MNSESEFIREFVELVTNELKAEPICAENSSEAKSEGDKSFNKEIKSIFCEARKTFIDSFITSGVKNQIGSAIKRIKKKQINAAERFGDLSLELIIR
jgi:hypothetical protein